MISPVIKLDASEARKTAGPTISSSNGILPRGMVDVTCAVFSGVKRDFVNSVKIRNPKMVKKIR